MDKQQKGGQGRGASEKSPSNITEYLQGIDFPCWRQEVVDHAEENGAGKDMLRILRGMPDQEFSSIADVTKAYNKAQQKAA
ncbi:MAG TPA: DUF2795 domain-containing protein [Nitrospirota bacterium]|nr:DUF2795 domain-containing protein [Nitrospirota bacterium]